MRNSVCLFSTFDPVIDIYCTSEARSRHSFAKPCIRGEIFTRCQWLHHLPADITAGKRVDCVRHGTNTCKTDGHMFIVIPREGKRKSGNWIWAWQERIMTMLHKSVLIHFCVLIWSQKMFFGKTGEENDFIIKQNNKCHQLSICCSVQNIYMSCLITDFYDSSSLLLLLDFSLSFCLILGLFTSSCICWRILARESLQASHCM